MTSNKTQNNSIGMWCCDSYINW